MQQHIGSVLARAERCALSLHSFLVRCTPSHIAPHKPLTRIGTENLGAQSFGQSKHEPLFPDRVSPN